MIVSLYRTNYYTMHVILYRPVHWLNMETVDTAAVKNVIDTTNRTRTCLTQVTRVHSVATIACIGSIRESLLLPPSKLLRRTNKSMSLPYLFLLLLTHNQFCTVKRLADSASYVSFFQLRSLFFVFFVFFSSFLRSLRFMDCVQGRHVSSIAINSSDTMHHE